MAISAENRQFFPPRVFNAPAEGFPLELGIVASGQKAQMVGYQVVKTLDTFNRLDNTGCDGQTDTLE